MALGMALNCPCKLITGKLMTRYIPVGYDHFTDVLRDIHKSNNWRIIANVDTPLCPSTGVVVLTFLSDDSCSGFALVREGNEDTELCSVFSTVKGRGHGIMKTATHIADAMGIALTLNCFDGYLVGFYARYGFKETRRVPNWVSGEPDVVYMRREAAETTQTDQ